MKAQTCGAISSQHIKPRAELRRRSFEAESRYTAATVVTVSSSKTLTGGLTAFSRRPELAEFRCVRGDARVAVQKTKRRVNQLLHSGAGDLTAKNDHAVAEYHTVRLEIPVYHAVAEYSERKTDPMFSLRADNGECGSSRKLVGTSVRLVGGEWKIHYVRRTRDVAGRNRKHQYRVKRKGTR